MSILLIALLAASQSVISHTGGDYTLNGAIGHPAAGV
jgi:hypothetical protein